MADGKWRSAQLLALFSLILVVNNCKHGAGGSSRGSNSPDPAGTSAESTAIVHVDQGLIKAGVFQLEGIVDLGGSLFTARFTDQDGAGALLLPDGMTRLPSRFARIPPGGGRVTGPNARSCLECHDLPIIAGAGGAAANILVDPEGDGLPPFDSRNPPSLAGAGALQLLAEEITADLLAIRGETVVRSKPGEPPVTRELTAKGISYGTITASRDANGVLSVDLSGLQGIDPDLVIRPFGLKGFMPSLRGFCRGAALLELGMEPDELVARDPGGSLDPDGDGVEGELTVGDITAMTIFTAARHLPQFVGDLIRDGLIAPIPLVDALQIVRGDEFFLQIGCDRCHRPDVPLYFPLFEEPTFRAGENYLDPGIDPSLSHLDPEEPFQFHLIHDAGFSYLDPYPTGGYQLKIYGDLKRHNMGSQLADASGSRVMKSDGQPLEVEGEPVEIPPAVFLTAELWGVGSTGPWLHDGRAGTLEEAILLHGVDFPPAPGNPARSEAQEERDAYKSLPAGDREDLIEFLRSLILFEFPADFPAAVAPPGSGEEEPPPVLPGGYPF